MEILRSLSESESNKVGEMQLDFKYGSDKLQQYTNSTSSQTPRWTVC